MALVNALEWAGGTNTSEQINTKIQEMIASGEISGEGWAIVKVGQVTFASIAIGVGDSETVSIADLGFSSVDDYEVVLSLVAGSASSYYNQMIYTRDRSAASFKVASLNHGTTVATNVIVAYAVISRTQVVSPVQEALVQRVVDETIQTHTGVWERYDSATDELVYTDDEQGLVNERRLSIKPADTGWQQLVSGNDAALYRKVGGVVEVRVGIANMASLAVQAVRVVGTLPEGCRPVGELAAYGIALSANWNNQFTLYATSNGAITVRNNSDAAVTSAYGNLIFLAG